MQRQSNVAEPIPPFFLKTVTNLEDSLNAALAKEKEAKKKMNAVNARALNSMKQKVRKSTKEYEKEISQYQAVSNVFKSVVLPYTSCRTRRPLYADTLYIVNRSKLHLQRRRRSLRKLLIVITKRKFLQQRTTSRQLEKVVKLCNSPRMLSSRLSRLYMRPGARRFAESDCYLLV